MTVFHSDVIFFYQSLLLGFSIIVKYYLFSKVIQYTVLENFQSITLFLHSLFILFLTEFTNSYRFLSCYSSNVLPVCSSLFCKGTTLGRCLVTWVGSHLRAVVSPIAFPCLFYFLFCDNSCEPSKSIKGQCVNICQVPWEQCLDDLVV